MAGLRLPAAQLNFPPPDPAPSLSLGLTPCTQLAPKLHLGVSFRRTQCTTRRGIEMDSSPAGCDKAPLGAGTHSSLGVHLLQRSLFWIGQEGERPGSACPVPDLLSGPCWEKLGPCHVCRDIQVAVPLSSKAQTPLNLLHPRGLLTPPWEELHPHLS